MRTLRRMILFLALLVVPIAGAWASAADRAQLLRGVRTIAAPGLPGSVVATGPEAFAVVAGKSADGGMAPVVAAARFGRGRIVAFGHDGYLGDRHEVSSDTGRLLVNATDWAAGGRTVYRAGVVQKQPMLDLLIARGGIVARAADLSVDFSHYDVLVMNHDPVTDALIPQLRTFVQNGGGLVLASTGWGWQQIFQKELWQHPLNQITAFAGLAWTPGTLETTTAGGFAADAALPRYLHAGEAMKAVLDAEVSGTRLPEGDAVQADASLLLALRSVGSSDPFVLIPGYAVRALVGSRRFPTPQNPVTAKDPAARFALALDLVTPTQIVFSTIETLNPASATFPGAVPDNAPFTSRTVSVDTRISGWHNTGLYAKPGIPVLVQIPLGAMGKGLSVRIGAHTDTLWHLDRWERAPVVSRSHPMNDTFVKLASSAFGGPIYIEVPENSALGKVDVLIATAVEAPYFKLGETSAADWRNSIRSRPGPWAELAGQRVILTVPSSAIRNLADPTPLLQLWDAIDEAQDILAGFPADPLARPERMVADQQIGYGYMHAGYPIMTGLDVVDLVVDEPKLRREGSFGHFHELGHEHQSDAWTFDGTGEVTVNIFTMYSYERVLGVPFTSGHPDIKDRAQRLARIRAHVNAGAPFAQWKEEPFLALLMYIQMIEGFGWGPFQKVFIEYRGLPANQLPRNDDQKRDQWLVRFSTAVGRNLGPFFQAWGVPTSDAARASIQHLPRWMPADMPTP